jgi:predicted metalloprotease with PDZ domain
LYEYSTLEFSPGELGVRLEHPKTGIVKEVTELSAADLAGIQIGWKLLNIDGKKYRFELLKEKIQGTSKYQLKFKTEVTLFCFCCLLFLPSHTTSVKSSGISRSLSE